MVSDIFLPELVHNCNFFGLVRIGKLEPYYLEFHNLRRPVGLYNSTIISCDIGNNVVIDNVNYLSHYIIGNEVMLVNVNELATTDHAKFGNGILKEGEPESIRIELEICNENGGRSIFPSMECCPVMPGYGAGFGKMKCCRNNSASLPKMNLTNDEVITEPSATAP